MQKGYKVVIELKYVSTVWYDEDEISINEDENEQRAIDYVLGNEYNEIRKSLERNSYVDEIISE